ncbi:MAG: hypothetical protein LQ339_008022 [Xanthoria mediterranea]|nr:MAG: hypothetical protein LQ339_008022 [Xanthoria mediterranea]
MFEIFRTTPSSVPRPYGCGRFDQDGVEIHFLLMDYIDMKNELPDPVALSRVIAHLHRTSMSPTAEFGFFATTCHGKVPQRVTWERSWTSFYRNLLQAAIRKDFEANGPWPALEKVAPIILNKVVPRLLGALESGGRSIKPALIHGDLWEGNIAVRRESGDILLIDAAAYYAHSEMEIGMWRCERHAIHDPKFTKAYLQQMPKDEPVEEWDDRNRLYCVKMNIVHSAHHRNAKERQTAFEDMCYLVNKYGGYTANARPQVVRTESFMQAAEAAKFH